MGEKVKFRRPVLYRMLYIFVATFHRLYYRRFKVIGFEKIPPNTPVIFAPNHQNALMDALAVLFAARQPVVFLARADIFKKPAVARLLNFIRMLPIYRIRDGYDSLENNQGVFDNTIDVLKSNIPLCILPEGNHEGIKRLRSLKKGIFRIAFQAEESTSYQLNLHIIPVGLDYSNYFKPGSDLTVVFGTPIKIADYIADYQQNEQRTVNALRNVLAEGMRSVMIHIPEAYYNTTYLISEMYEANVWDTLNVKRPLYNKLTIKQYIVQKITEAFSLFPEKAELLSSRLSVYTEKLNRLGFKDCLLQKKTSSFLSLFLETILTILLLPLHLYGVILNYLPFMIPVWVARQIKDKHFQSSIHFGISIFSFPLYYLIVITLFCMFTDDYFVKLIFGLTLPLTGFFAFYNHKHMKNLIKRLHFFVFRHTKPEQYNALASERNQLIELIKATINS